MAKLHWVLGGFVLFVFIGFIWVAERSSVDSALRFFVPIIAFVCFGVFIALIIRFAKAPKTEYQSSDEKEINILRRPSINVIKAKFIVSKYLLVSHGIDIVSYGKTVEDSIYKTSMIAGRCFPSGEESWYVKLKVNNNIDFGGLETRIIIYLNGSGNIIGEFFMNKNFGFNQELWHDPTLFFTKGPSKTPKPHSLKDLVYRHVEATGEIPSDLNFGKLEEFDQMQ